MRSLVEGERNLAVIFVKSHTWPLPAYTERNSGNKAHTNRSLAWKRMKTQLTPETHLSVPMSKYQMKFKEQGKQLTSSAPTFFPLQLLKRFTVSLSLLGYFPHQTNESPNRRLAKMFTYGELC